MHEARSKRRRVGVNKRNGGWRRASIAESLEEIERVKELEEEKLAKEEELEEEGENLC